MLRTASVVAALFAVVPSQAAVTFDFAWVGNAGNAPDPLTGFGAVPYEYAIAKTEVTNAQYAEFLNAVDPTGENRLALYSPKMADTRGGIELSGTEDGARYLAQPGRERQPVSHVSWFDAVRFANWMHNGQGDGDTEAGVYDFGPFRGVAVPLSPQTTFITRQEGARYWIPSEDEWYKAAYHDATAGTAGEYFLYATQSNEPPISDHPEDNPAGANYTNDDGDDTNGFNDGRAVGPTPTGDANPFSDVGAYFLATSPYGTFDQNGNVEEWHDTHSAFGLRGTRGGAWRVNRGSLVSTTRLRGRPDVESSFTGFRIASIPEPSAVWLVAVGMALLRRRSRRA